MFRKYAVCLKKRENLYVGSLVQGPKVLRSHSVYVECYLKLLRGDTLDYTWNNFCKTRRLHVRRYCGGVFGAVSSGELLALWHESWSLAKAH